MEKEVEQLARFIPAIKSISDSGLRAKTAEVYMELFSRSDWKRIPDHFVTAELKVSDVEHTNAVVEICVRLAQTMKKFHKVDVNMDWVISAAILHDASKLVEFVPRGRGQVKSKSGELYQHTLECLHLMMSKGLPKELVHAVLSHTPMSNVAPQTVEAVLLYYADCVDYNVLRLVNGLELDLKK